MLIYPHYHLDPILVILFLGFFFLLNHELDYILLQDAVSINAFLPHSF